MVSPVRGISSQTRSHVQINIYGTTVDALRSRGVDLERLLSSLGCRCVVMDVPELPSESTELVSVTSFQGCEDWINDITTRSGQTSATKEADVEVDSEDGLPVSAVQGSAHNTTVSRTSVRPKACDQVTGRCKGGGLESPPTKKLHCGRAQRSPKSHDSGGKPGTVAPGKTGLQESFRLPKRKRTRATICTYNAQTLASNAAIEDLMMQIRKINYDVIGLTETRTIIDWELFASLVGFWEDTIMDNIDDEYKRLVEHLHDCTSKAKSFKTTKKRLSPKTPELIRQRGAARAAGNQELTSVLARLCREAIKEDLKEGRAEVLGEAAEAGQGIRYARRNFANRKTTMTALRTADGTTTASRRGMEKVTHDFYSDLFDSHVHLNPHHLREDGRVIQKVLPSDGRHAIMSMKNRTSPGLGRIKPEHLKYLPPVFINTLTRLFTRYLSECKSEPQPYRVPHDHEINCCPIISELSADSFVDSKLFVNPKEDPASQTFPMKSCLVFDDAKLNSFCVGSESSSERKFGLRELEELPGSDTVISRMPRRRAPPPSFSPPEPREIKRRRKLKLAYGSRTVVRGDGTFECKIPGCGKILHFKQSCRRQGLDHVRSHFPKKTRRCKICDYSGNTNASVYNHHTSCHSSTPYPGPVAAETKEDLELLQRLFSQAFPEIPGIESYMSVIS
ncbi:hypothetical protein RB195_005369 [Necator americanus]|uniref:C2H2-type domain-containing protein n=1 Tax=Necator americanus TaxID=51031 RepID=A0ABR1BQX5_NECAM